MSLVYHLFFRLVFRIGEFFRHWYFDSFKIYINLVLSLLERFDRKLAFKITLRNLFQPLYQDRSFIGYTLGFIFRSGRLFMGGLVYLIILAAAIAFYLAWLAVPIYVVFKVVYG